ncbi:MAG: N-acetyl-gamma-glutamyl-phosphate reductase [Candidatus Dormibacteria bacterium]
MTEKVLRAAVAGATGYIGMQCVELLRMHPQVDLVRVMARSGAGRRFSELVPGSRLELELHSGIDPGDVDVLFACLPHGAAAEHAQGWLDSGAVLLDLSADFRMRDAADHQRWYGGDHPAPELCAEAVYALPELLSPPPVNAATDPERGASLRAAGLIATPGCYPTAALLAIVPGLRAGLVEPDLIVDAKSGVSGAGRSPGLGNHYAEVNESVTAYGVSGHRHRAELDQELRLVAGGEVRLTFVPHLVPMTRGILVTAYLRLRPPATVAALTDVYRELCAAHPFLHYSETPPATKTVIHSNTAALHVAGQGDSAVVLCAIDNLLKGGAGQAVQAMNLRFSLPETAGLPMGAPWP